MKVQASRGENDLSGKACWRVHPVGAMLLAATWTEASREAWTINQRPP
jgi:hypothetical protein